ncbi:GNAT family N-acetyltransferase [Snodgrassella alvi]|uniref:GNAT family N-acetyltransferase n=1 Tax=Snodgrassella alvi TaxID=1196083 RepID=UPI00345F29F8
MTDIIYRNDVKPSLAEATELYSHCTLGGRRPIGDEERFQLMLDNANLIITAWDKDRLVGIARCLTDFVYVTYLADLAVDERYQKQGIGKQLIRVVLIAAPQAVDYYGHIGFSAHPSAWTLNKQLK